MKTWSVLVWLVWSLLCSGCVSGVVVSSGAALPQDSEDFHDGTLKAQIDHNCSGGRCSSLDVKFTNLSKTQLTLLISSAAIMRAGQKVSLEFANEKEKKSSIVLAPMASVSLELSPAKVKGAQYMSYARPASVWCSVKKHPQCQNAAKAESACAGFARYYYDMYTSTGGWISFLFPYSVDGRNETLTSPPPRVVKLPPSPVLTVNESAPSFLLNPDDVVFYKVECDANCSCKEITSKRNFFLDDKIKPEF